jgi:hypothetical protein
MVEGQRRLRNLDINGDGMQGKWSEGGKRVVVELSVDRELEAVVRRQGML